MIHDIDIVQTIVGAPIASIDAIGTKVFSDEIDIANARIRFENGCVGQRYGEPRQLQDRAQAEGVRGRRVSCRLDLQQKILTVIRKRADAPPGQLPASIEEQSFDQGDALKAESRVVSRLHPHRQAPDRGRRGGHARP